LLLRPLRWRRPALRRVAGSAVVAFTGAVSTVGLQEVVGTGEAGVADLARLSLVDWSQEQ